MRNPIAMSFMPDGTLGLLELFPAKVEKITLAGEPAGSVPFVGGEGVQTGFTVAVDFQYRAGVLMLAGMRGAPADEGQRRSHYVAGYDEVGNEQVRYRESEALLTFDPPTFVEDELLPPFWFGAAVGPDGRVYLASSRDSYTIEVYLPDCTLERIIERDFEIPPRDARDRHRMQAMVDAWYTGVPVDVECHFGAHADFGEEEAGEMEVVCCRMVEP